MQAVRIIRQADQITTEWSGGTTTQLAIYPPDSTYASRAFRWRLSSATVNVPESTFTPLSGFNRILMILSGTMRLKHEGHHETLLHAFEQDTFDGSWTTTSFGQAVDFNLMTGVGASGDVSAITLRSGEETKITPVETHPTSKGHAALAIYVFSGSAQACIEGEKYFLNEKDVLLVEEERPSKEKEVFLRAAELGGGRIIQARINY